MKMPFEQFHNIPEAEAAKAENQEKYKQFLEELKKVGVRYEAARHFELGEINYDYFTNLDPKELQHMKNDFTWCREFLEMPYQLDNFGADHRARRAWEKEIEDKYGREYVALIGRSKLSGGILNGINYTLDWLTHVAIESKSPEFKELGKKLNQIWEEYKNNRNSFAPYDELDDAGKKKQVELLEDKIFEILKITEELTNKR